MVRLALSLFLALALLFPPSVFADKIKPHCDASILQSSLMWLIRKSLGVRYDIKVKGLEEIAQRGTTNVAFFPMHPAMVDPMIVEAVTFPYFRTRPAMIETFFNMRALQPFFRMLNPVKIPDMDKDDPEAEDRLVASLAEIDGILKGGGNIALWPSGRIMGENGVMEEKLGANTAVHEITTRSPSTRIVMVRITGLEGSSWGRWQTGQLDLSRAIRLGAQSLVMNGVVGTPKREVTVEFVEATDFPRTGTVLEKNRYLEAYYNQGAETRTNRRVPYYFWSSREPQVWPPPPAYEGVKGDESKITDEMRQALIAYLKEEHGLTNPDLVTMDAELTSFGLNSLDRGKLGGWLFKTYGHTQETIEKLRTVRDVLLTAAGEGGVTRLISETPVDPRWFQVDKPDEKLVLPEGKNLLEMFLKAAYQTPDKVIIGDELSATPYLTYRDIITRVLILKKHIEKLKGDRVGILLPSSTGGFVTWLATMAAGKVPVMVNYTVGERNLEASLNTLEVDEILTSKAFIAGLKRQGTSYDRIRRRYVYLENIGKQVGWYSKAKAAITARLDWSSLWNARVSDTAAILMTSGSESLPKSVPLTHRNISENIREAMELLGLKRGHSMIGFLPFFHSFGGTVTAIAAAAAGMRVFYTPSPYQYRKIAALVEKHKISIIPGTPTYVDGVQDAATPEQLASVSIVVTGAEKMPDYLRTALYTAVPRLEDESDGSGVFEAYGTTECSPIVCMNFPGANKPGTVGRVLPKIDYLIVDPGTRKVVERGKQGLLVVRGANVFAGYYQPVNDAPFWDIEHQGKTVRYYVTADLVTEDDDLDERGRGFITIRGRLKRFVKRGGGEMVSLPAIEEVLINATTKPDGHEGPLLAVEATAPDGANKLVLFLPDGVTLDREGANRIIRRAGLNELHYIDRIVQLRAIPILGTGKTDYQTLKAQIAETR